MPRFTSFWRRRSLALSLIALVTMLVPGCLDVEPPDGVLECASVAECPDETWQCRDNGAGALRCYRGEGADAGMVEDTSTMDVPTDTNGLDVRLDTPGDGGIPDTRPACVDPAVDCPAETTCSVYACVAGECMVQERGCDDGIECTDDRCVVAGDVGCVNPAGGPLSCGVGQICAPDADDADPTTGCATAPECVIAAGCNDMDDCTTDDCVAGSCTFTPVTCSADADLCTSPPVCVAGTCTPETPITCVDDANMCTSAGVCNPATGMCAYPAITCATDSSPCTILPTCAPSTGCSAESFDPGSLTNVAACGSSAAMCMACPTPTFATPTCVGGACGYSCTAGHIDLDMAGSNGCEYACTVMTPTDAPDLAAVDANCDGADGDIAGGRVIYVSPTGTGDGSRPGMAASLAMAFTILNGSSGRNLLLLQLGSYSTPSPLVAMTNFEMWGGYSADYRSRSGTTTVLSTAPTALGISNVTNATIVGVDFITTNRTVPGESAHTVVVVNSPNVRFSEVSITAGRGAPGIDGGNGVTGLGGTLGSNGMDALNPSFPGAGGGSGAGRGGGGGGQTSGGTSGTAGETTSCPVGSMGGMPGGGGTLTTTCPTGVTTNGGMGSGGGGGCNGTSGPPGLPGMGDGMVGAVAGAITWVGPVGGTGVIGAVGARGGGGGGGGGITCPGSGSSAGGGGAGGSGGSGGRGGSGGGAGGASIGILLMNSIVTFDDVAVALNTAGPGGRGGDGGLGGNGGSGGGGGLGWAAGTFPTLGVGGRGGPGGAGGRGGRGGCGGGGVGGVAAGVFQDATSGIVESGTGLSVTGGAGGTAGMACSAGGGVPGDPGRLYRVAP